MERAEKDESRSLSLLTLRPDLIDLFKGNKGARVGWSGGIRSFNRGSKFDKGISNNTKQSSHVFLFSVM
jgi:hypothetical protein